jgi:hypothetical protein
LHIDRHGQAGRQSPRLPARVKKDAITFNEQDSRNLKEEECIIIEIKHFPTTMNIFHYHLLDETQLHVALGKE